MKFISIMRNLSISFLILFFGTVAMAQTNINSPYSSLGLGELSGLDHAVSSALGNTTITLQDSTLLNFYNPATYSALGQGQPLFSFGVSTRLSTFSENGASSFNSVTGIQNFAFGLAFSKHFGLAFGLKPYARRGYEFSSRLQVEEDSLIYKYSGEGGVNEVFLGLSSNLLKYRGATVSVGANFGYLFGNTSNTRKSGLIQSGSSTYAGGISVKSMQVRAFHYEIGLNYLQKINDKHTLSISSVIEPFQKINGTYEEGVYYGSNIDNPNDFDTTSFVQTEDGNVTNVPSYTFGLNYTLRATGRKGSTNELNSAVSFHASYNLSDWSKYENRFDNTFTNTFLNTTKMTFGVEYIPETDFITNKVTTKFYHRMKYRIGVYQLTLPYVTNGQQVSDFGTTFGFGIPIVVQNSLSSINLGFTIGKRGVADTQAFKEQYYGINIGVSIAPGTDRWFVKRKLN